MAEPAGFEGFCGGRFWDTNVTWDTPQPELTPCFERTVLTWAAPALVWISLPVYAIYLARTADPAIHKSRLYAAKVLFCVLAAICSGVQLVDAIVKSKNDPQLPLVFIVSPAITTATLVLVCIIIYAERKRGLLTSGVLFLFWLLNLVAGVPIFYSLVLHSVRDDQIEDRMRFVIFFILYGISLIELVLFSFAEKGELDETICPEATSSFLSRISYSWLNGLVIAGYKKGLEEKDIWRLNYSDQSASTGAALDAAWRKELTRCKWQEPEELDLPRARVGQSLECKTESFKRHQYTSNSGQRSSKKSPNLSLADDERAPLLAAGDQQLADDDVRVAPGRSGKYPSLFRAMFRVFGLTLLEAHLCKLVCDILTFIGPTLQRLLIGFTEDKNAPEWRGFLYAALFFALPIVNSFFFQMLFHIGLKLGMKIKSAVIYLVYQKALVLSNEARKETTVGEIVNLMSVDAQRLQDVTGYLWMVWSSPLQIAIAVWLLWGLLGPSVLAGLAIMILLIPANVLLAARQQKLQVLQMTCKDDRIKLMDEVLNGMKVLKLYAWELAFGKKVKAIRDVELEHLQSYATLAGIGSFSWTMATFMVMLSTFTAYVLSGHKLEAETAFVALSLFNILSFPINLLPLMISYMVTATVSIKRLGKFLRQEELDPSCVSSEPGVDMPIVIKDASFAWGTSNEGSPTLTRISLSVPDGSLVAVVGQVGAGKSSLISAMLGEMDKLQGSINLTGSVAYVAQQAWIQNATLKDNILFGKPFDQERYDQVIEACALRPDLDILPGGDQTEIGEKGINLSGGQKQRVSLARAVYSDADVYLLDDPLSAVDAHVGKHIYDKVIGDAGLLKYKTRVLVTHGLHWLPRVDMVAVLVLGHLSEVGTYEQLLEQDGAFAQFLRTYLLSEGDPDDETADPEVRAAREAIMERLDSLGPRSATDGSGAESGPEGTGGTKRRRKRLARSASAKTEDDPDCQPPLAAGTKLVSEEKSQVGKVEWGVFAAYARALGLANTSTLVISYLLFEASSVAANIWLTQWTNDPTPINSSDYLPTRDYYLGIYGGLGGLQAVFILIYALMLAFSMVKASRLLHHNMLLRILRCPMSFFDTTPSGRILNRFSRDVETVDNVLPELIRNWMNTFFIVLSGIVVIAYSTPIFLTVVLPLGIVYYLIQRFYIPTSRQLKRLESTTRSPVYSHFSETVTGASTIRAYRAQGRFLDKSNTLVDHNLIFYFASMASNRWLGFRLDVISACIVLAAALFSVLSRNTLTGGIVGLSISYALQVTSELNWMVRVTSDLETNIVSVERIKEYSETPTEAALDDETTRPDPSWPPEGAVTFRNYSTRYRNDLDLVLNNVNFSVSAGEKVGIVGRTGAGKSSLTLALFRIIEPSLGTILLDGVDVVPLGLHQLRSKITILPQDPVLFSGTLRSNIDPLDTQGESAIWEAIRRSNLDSFVKSLPAGLSYECGEGGLNLSVGQRQLVCLARALLHKTRLLVLDEATAAVDMETDELIQATIRREFAECTVLSIAHRINTIMDYDRILVLDKGRVAEYDSPSTLLKDDKTIFYGLAQEAGLV